MGGRNRGYRFEDAITKRYVSCGWRAWRLGASSVGLPDVLAVGRDSVHVHELKTSIRDSVRVPAHQIARCADVASAFGRYRGVVVLSARFGRRAEHHYIWDGAPANVGINVSGVVSRGAARRITWDELVGNG